MAAELRPGHLLNQFLERTQAAGQSHERVGALEHRALALMHVAGDDQFLREPPRPLSRSQELGDDAGHFAAVLDHGTGERAHQADRAAAVNQPHPVCGKDFAELACGRGKGRIGPDTRPAIDAQRVDFAHGVLTHGRVTCGLDSAAPQAL